MKWNSILDKLRQEEFQKSVLRSPLMVVTVLIVIAISLVNFSTKDSVECPAILTYDEISEAVTLIYCQIDQSRYQIEAIDKTGTIRADQLQYTVEGQITKVPLSDSKLIVNSLPDYVLLNLIFSDACFQNNSPDVSFPIDLSAILDCSGNAPVSIESTTDLNEFATDEFLEEKTIDESPVKELIKQDLKVDLVQNKEASDKWLGSQKTRTVENKYNEKKPTKSIEIKSNSNVSQTSTQLNTQKIKNTVIKKKSVVLVSDVEPEEVKRNSSESVKSTAIPKSDQIKKALIPLESTEDKIIIKSVVDLDNQGESKGSTDELVKNANVMTSQSVSLTENVINSSEKKLVSSKNVSLFNTKEIGIKKSCTDDSHKIMSETDLFTISIKPNRGLTLYDVHCYAVVNSEITITLSQLGQVLKTFNVALNKGENQIGLTSLGLLDSNEAYLVECKTKNKGDVYLFSDCKISNNYSNEVLIRYIDNHTALYGLTYEIEIE